MGEDTQGRADERDANTPAVVESTPGAFPALPAGFFCPECGYDLRGLTSNRCPECGSSLDIIRSTESQIPWVHRREWGRIRTYWRTVGLAMFRGKHLALEFSRPVDYYAASRFRWVTVLHAWTAVLLAQLGWYLFDRDSLTEFIEEWGLWMLLVEHALVPIWLAALTGLPTLFLWPRRLPVELRDRAVALSYYSAAPLAWLPILIGLLMAGCVFGLANDEEAPLLVGLGGLALFAVFVWWWLALVWMVQRTLRRRIRTAVVLVCVPLLWLSAVLAIHVLFTALIFYIVAILHSLR